MDPSAHDGLFLRQIVPTATACKELRNSICFRYVGKMTFLFSLPNVQYALKLSVLFCDVMPMLLTTSMYVFSSSYSNHNIELLFLSTRICIRLQRIFDLTVDLINDGRRT